MLLAAPNSIEAQMARELLDEAGIPSILWGKDRDLAELGAVVHNVLTRPDLYVRKGERDRANAVLDKAWDKDALDSGTPEETWAADGQASRERDQPCRVSESRRRGYWVWAVLVLVVAAIVFVMGRDYFRGRL